MRHPSKTDLAEEIFLATDRLMAKEGLNQLSMHKLAKEANISAGTIYLYFKNKDELLEKFAYRLFERFTSALDKDFDESESFFEQYRRMWWNLWSFLQSNPTILCNLNQYQSLPNFTEVCKTMRTSRWDYFCQKGQEAGMLADLPSNLMFLLSIKTAFNLSADMKFIDVEVNDEILESVIARSWRAIQK